MKNEYSKKGRIFNPKNFLKDNSKAYNKVLNKAKENKQFNIWRGISNVRIYKLRKNVYEVYKFYSHNDFNPQPFLIKEDNYYI